MTRRSPQEYNFSTLSFDQTWLTKHYSPINKVDKRFVVIHHMTIVGDNRGSALDACWNVWQTRQASAHYGVDGGYIRQYVRDKDFAWATGSNTGNLYGISIELANSSAGPNWEIGRSTLTNAAKLAAWIHITYKLGRPVSGKTLRRHKEFVATACPGPFVDKHWAAFVKDTQQFYDTFTKPKKTEGQKQTNQVKAANAASKRAKKAGKKVQARRLKNAAQWRAGKRSYIGAPAQRAVRKAADQALREGRTTAAKRLNSLHARIRKHRKGK